MSVFAIPASNTLADINPRYNPALNPNYPDRAEWDAVIGQAAITIAWCGACYGDEVGEFWLPLSGGHGDYAGNEPYKISLFADIPQWQMVRPPSGAIGNTLITNDGQEASGVYSDGRPRAIHSYNKSVWIPGQGPSISVQGSTSWSGQSGVWDFLKIDRTTGEATRTAFASIPIGNASGLGACYDPSRHCIWARGVGTGYWGKLDIASMQWSTFGVQEASSGYHGLCYIPGHDVIFDACTFYTSGVGIVDCVTGVVSQPVVIGAAAATLGGTMQPVWVADLGAVAVWDNSAANASKVTLLTPGANPRTDAWTASTLEFSVVDQPTGKTQYGTYGRFFYSRRLGGFGVLNATSQPIYFFAMR